MAASRRKQDDKNLEILRELICVNGNKYCLDCNQRGPTYVNTTIGSFVCSKCSGMLRGLTPPHRVKSISMATFTPDEMEFIKSRGNDFCRRVWLGLYEGESVNYAEEQSVKDFMSDKYEKKRYYLESTASNTAVTTNGVSGRNKSKSRSGSAGAGSTPLISISPQTSINQSVNNNSFVSAPKTVEKLPAVNQNSYKLARPVNHFVPQQNFFSHTISAQSSAIVSAPTSVPDFPVDFSTAIIYNSSQDNNNMNNNLASQPSASLATFNSAASQNASSNDRYAALADLDHAFREQNMKAIVSEETNRDRNMNPFQSATTSDFFANKNPFANGGWSAVPVNPFVTSSNSGSLANSNNPFL